MAVRTRDELMSTIKDYLGEDTSDAALSLVQDISDTLGDSNAQTVADLRQQLKDQDENWRKKYRDTFFSGTPEKDDDDPPEPKKPRTFAELFKTE